MLRTSLFLTLFLIAGGPASAWGNLGHRMVATGALKDLPREVGAWFEGHEEVVADHANDPDRWKGTDPLEGPRHFLDCEPYGRAAQVPQGEDEAMALLGPALFQATGQAPWVILERVHRLTLAFASGNAGAVAWEASILSHYVGDLNVPLHTTLNYNGQSTRQAGVHGRWEGELLERIVGAEGWSPEARVAELGEGPWEEPWEWLKESFILMPDVLSDDLRAQRSEAPGGAEPGPEYWEVFTELQGPHVKTQLTLAAQRTARMILLAWTRAGSPGAVK